LARDPDLDPVFLGVVLWVSFDPELVGP